MKISELFVRQGNVEIEGTIKEINEPRTFNKFGKELRVADAILEDDSGAVKLTLWNEDIDNFKAGDKVRITNGYVNEFQGEKQLTSGKFGKIEKVGKGDTIEENEQEAPSQEVTEESLM
jgi:ssDNA-binding replication factor A large subunit